MSFLDIVTLIGVVFAVIAAVVGGVFAVNSTIRTQFCDVHTRIDQVSKDNADNHLKVTTQITRLEERIKVRSEINESIRRA